MAAQLLRDKMGYCVDCGETVADFNMNKDQCIACMPFKKVASLPGPFKTRRTFGIEFEVEFNSASDYYDETENHDIKNWARQPDGSLDMGWEYVSPIFAGHNKPVKMINEFCQAVKKLSVSTPSTTGTHIHIGIDDFTDQQKFRLIKNAVAVEPQVEKLVPRNRFNSTFLEVYDTKYDEDIQDMMYDHYSWINLSQVHPTVEIRALEGTLDPKRVEHWIELWLGFVKVSKRGRIKDIFQAMTKAGTRQETIDYFKNTMR